jgi:hypothetical protein
VRRITDSLKATSTICACPELKLEEALHSQDKTTFEIITKKKKTLELDSAVISMSQNGSRSYIATKVWNIYMYST